MGRYFNGFSAIPKPKQINMHKPKRKNMQVPTQKNGNVYCTSTLPGDPEKKECGGQCLYRKRTKDYACVKCPATYPLSSLTPTQDGDDPQ
jgi:hypothetical protein